MKDNYDVLIMITPKDFRRLQCCYEHLAANMPGEKLYFVGNTEVGQLVEESGLGEKVGFINEESILPFDAVNDVMKQALGIEEVPRGITGWYYQQFLKMSYAAQCEKEYYLMWDGDTIPCKPFSMYSPESGEPYLDLKTEYHEEYFVTLAKLLPGMHKCIQKSFIAEHMLMNCKIMKELIAAIESNEAIKGKTYYEKVLWSIDREKLQENSFSEFETYGTYVAFKHLTHYRLRDWHSFRHGGVFFDPQTISEEDYEWLGRDFFAISFEKGDYVRDDHKNLFDNKEYQSKLSARQMLQIAQEEFKDGYVEVWD